MLDSPLMSVNGESHVAIMRRLRSTCELRDTPDRPSVIGSRTRDDGKYLIVDAPHQCPAYLGGLGHGEVDVLGVLDYIDDLFNIARGLRSRP